MTRILIVETASPGRVRRKAEEILAGGVYAEPQVTILCKDDPVSAAYYGAAPGVSVVRSQRPALRDLKNQGFDVLLAFWTGEQEYSRMKRKALRLGARRIDIDAGDGSFFRLSWKAWLRFALFRRKHPLPTDHWEFLSPPEQPAAPEHYPGEKILIIQSADPSYVLRALEKMRERPLFSNPRFVLFCRNNPEVTRHFQAHPMIAEVRTHTETRDSGWHLRRLRRERFDGAVLFLTGDPGYWKIKCFAFLLGTRHKVIFNESGDCFHFTWRAWLSLMAHRLGERSRLGLRPRWPGRVGMLLFLALKVMVLPIRFVWLLLVWLRLRSANLKAD